jgi:glycosyl transferase family 25
VAVDIPILVINLDRSGERLTHATRELAAAGLELTRVVAVDFRSMSAADIDSVTSPRSGGRSYYASLMTAEIACTLSHRRAWQAFLDRWTAPFAVILEDDFELRGDLRAVVSALQRTDSDGWDVIKLFNRNRRQAGAAALGKPDRYRLVRNIVVPTGTVGQIVSRAGAQKLLARTLPIDRPIDVQLQHWWELGLNVLTLVPPMIGEAPGPVSQSLLRREQPLVGVHKVKRELRRAVFRGTLLAKALYYYLHSGPDPRIPDLRNARLMAPRSLPTVTDGRDDNKLRPRGETR